MSKKLAILGSGHLGQQIAHFAISDNHYDEIYFYDDFNNDENVHGFKILGDSTKIIADFTNNIFDELIIAIGYNHLEKRKYFYESFKGKIPLGKIIHSQAWVDATAIIQEGCVLYPRCCIDANVKIKANTIINLSVTISHDTTVGKHCFIAPNVALAGFVNINEMCNIGINTTIIDGVTINSNVQTGGGTVVITNIEKKGLYVGNPQRLIREL
jgi:sugar O-acyltransferase (sialic acid O-acetyltransferase NeuD family)